jgi:DNA (cytosine-5)-methyltransferase 1
VFENVIGLTRPKHAARLSAIVARLKLAGFNVFRGELDASDFGVPQRRRRLFLVGLNRELYPRLEYEFPVGSGPKRNVADVLQDLPPPLFYSRSLSADKIPFHQNHWTMMPKSAKFAAGALATGRSFKRLAWDAVSPTVAYGNREIHVHPDGSRRLSILEAMLLQGFGRENQLSGSLSSQVTQVSNAVPPPVAEAIALSIKNCVLELPTSRDRPLPSKAKDRRNGRS